MKSPFLHIPLVCLVLTGCANFDATGSPIGLILLGGGSGGGGAASETVDAEWWSNDFTCRQSVTATATSAIVTGSLISLTFDHASLVSDGKSLASGDDVRVSYVSGGTTTEIDRTLGSGSSWNAADTRVVVQAQANIAAGASDANYYLYYCNPSATTPTSTVPATPATTVASTPTQTIAMDTTFNNVASSTFTPSATDEVWLWFVTFAVRSDTAQNTNATDLLGQVTLNGATDTEIEQQNNEANRWKILIVTGYVTGTTATQTIGLDVKSETAATTTEVKNIRIVSVLMPPDADFQAAVNDATVQTTTTWTNVGTALSFTPSSAGDYYVIAAGQHHENPSTTVSEMRFESHDGTLWPPLDNGYYSSNHRGPWDTFFVMRKINLTAGAKTFNMQFQSSNAGASASEYKGIRLFAFRADAFELTESQEDTAAASTTNTSAAPATASTLTTTAPSGERDHLIVQNMFLYDTNTGTTHQTAGDFREDGVVLSDQDHVLNRGTGYQFASGCVSSKRTSTSHTYDNRYWTNDGNATFVKESTIHVLRFKEPGVSYGGEETN